MRDLLGRLQGAFLVGPIPNGYRFEVFRTKDESEYCIILYGTMRRLKVPRLIRQGSWSDLEKMDNRDGSHRLGTWIANQVETMMDEMVEKVGAA